MIKILAQIILLMLLGALQVIAQSSSGTVDLQEIQMQYSKQSIPLEDTSLLYLQNSCPANQSITTTYVNNSNIHIEVSNSITANNIVNNGANVDYDAGKNVRMLPGFHAQPGSIFHAYIDGCVPNPNGCTVSGTISGTNASYQNTPDGAMEIIGSGGIPPYSYTWDNGSTSPVQNNVFPGTYSATVTDTDGCSFTASITVGFDNLCVDYLEINDIPIPSGLYLSSYEIFSIGTIMSGGDVKMGANHSILLDGGFEVMLGAELEVTPEGCLENSIMPLLQDKDKKN